MPAIFHRSWRPATAVLALTITSLAMPSLAHARRLFGGMKPLPRTSVIKAPKPPVAPLAPSAAKTPAATVAPINRSPGVPGKVGAVAVGATAGSLGSHAIAGGMADVMGNQAREAQALAAEKDAKDLQRQPDEAKRRAEATRAAVN